MINMKRFFSMVFVSVMAFSLVTVVAAYANYPPINVMVDNHLVHFSGQRPVMIDGSTLVPVRDMFGQLGFEIEWINEHQLVILRNESYVVVLTMGSTIFYTNNIGHTLDVPLQLFRGTAVLPLREVLESMGFSVDREMETWTVLVTSATIFAEPEPEVTPELFEDIEQAYEVDLPDEASGTDEPEDEPNLEPHPNEAVGRIIQFGDYDWRVLDVQNGRALIISELAIFERKYHHSFEAVTWETSELRQYLNNVFLDRFSLDDQKRIAETVVTNDNNPWFDIDGGNDTVDRVFLLSIEEVVRFFGDSGELYDPLHPSMIFGYNHERLVRTTEGWLTGWWLRTPGHFPMSASIVQFSGNIIVSGVSVDDDFFALYVRPAMWLYL